MATTTILELIANADTPLTSADVCHIADCTYRQLDYWVRSGLITPNDTLTETGSGKARRWDLESVLEAIIIAHLARAGVDIARLRDADTVDFARRLIEDLNDVLELIGELEDDRELVAV